MDRIACPKERAEGRALPVPRGVPRGAKGRAEGRAEGRASPVPRGVGNVRWALGTMAKIGPTARLEQE
jgi:hypothetical protein